MSKGSAYIKRMSLRFLCGRSFCKTNLSLSLLHASPPLSLLFHAQGLGIPLFTCQKVEVICLQERRKWEEEVCRSRSWSRNLDQGIDLSSQGWDSTWRRRINYEKISLRLISMDIHRGWTRVGLSIYKSVIIDGVNIYPR